MVLYVMKKCTAYTFDDSPDFLTLKTKAPHSAEMSETTHPTTTTTYHIPDDLNPQEEVKMTIFRYTMPHLHPELETCVFLSFMGRL
jgi:hypothetical protein